MSDFVFEDFNGDVFLTGGAGEREELLNNRVVAVPPGMPFHRTTAFNPANQDHQQHLDLFNRLNYWYYVRQVVERPAAVAGVHPIRAPDAGLAQRIRRIAYARTMSARMGHYHYNGTPANHHTRYSEYMVYDAHTLELFARDVFEDDTIDIVDLPTALAGILPIPNVADDRAWRSTYRSKHLNTVCIVAYFFRVRGHHWTAEMNDRYSSVWRKCLYDEDGPGLDWQYIAHDVLHAIFPDDLDNIWTNAANADNCAGALVKRVSSMPAGVAVVAALNAGVADLQLIVPRALVFVQDAVNHLNDVNQQLAGGRFAGSVNRRLYNAADVVPNETILAPLASVIRAGLESFAPNSPLLRSAALRRVADNAPMTGGVIGRMVNTAVRSDAAAEVFLPEPRVVMPP